MRTSGARCWAHEKAFCVFWGGYIRRGGSSEAAPEAVVGEALEEVAKEVGGGYSRLLKLAFAVRRTVAGHRLGALEGGYLPPVNASLGGGGPAVSCGPQFIPTHSTAGRQPVGTPLPNYAYPSVTGCRTPVRRGLVARRVFLGHSRTFVLCAAAACPCTAITQPSGGLLRNRLSSAVKCGRCPVTCALHDPPLGGRWSGASCWGGGGGGEGGAVGDRGVAAPALGLTLAAAAPVPSPPPASAGLAFVPHKGRGTCGALPNFFWGAYGRGHVPMGLPPTLGTPPAVAVMQFIEFPPPPLCRASLGAAGAIKRWWALGGGARTDGAGPTRSTAGGLPRMAQGGPKGPQGEWLRQPCLEGGAGPPGPNVDGVHPETTATGTPAALGSTGKGVAAPFSKTPEGRPGPVPGAGRASPPRVRPALAWPLWVRSPVRVSSDASALLAGSPAGAAAPPSPPGPALRAPVLPVAFRPVPPPPQTRPRSSLESGETQRACVGFRWLEGVVGSPTAWRSHKSGKRDVMPRSQGITACSLLAPCSRPRTHRH